MVLLTHGWNSCWRGLRLLGVCVAMVGGAVPVTGQSPADKSALQEQFLPDRVRAAGAAATVVGMNHPAAAASALIRGQDTSAWLVEPAPPAAEVRPRDGAPVLEPDLLAKVEDRKPLADANDNPDEVRAYYYVVLTARQTPFEVLLKDARRDLSYAHLFEDPEELRGQLVYLEGQLARLRRFDPPKALQMEGVKDLYEGWIFDSRYEGQFQSHCLVFTELPAGIQIGENIDYPVCFAGYLFKRYRVRNPRSVFDAPLLIGRTLQLMPATQATGASTGQMRQAFVIAFLIVGGATAGVIVGLAWWYRRSDRQVQQRLAQARPLEFGEHAEDRPTNGRALG